MRYAFTLVEMLVSLAVLSLLILGLSSLLSISSNNWVNTKGRLQQFSSARMSFDYMTHNLSQATLNTYWDYEYTEGASASEERPTAYQPVSDLQFKIAQAKDVIRSEKSPQSHAIFFQAPLGVSNQYQSLSNLLNARGYFVEFGDDLGDRPDFLQGQVPPRYRFRLKEFRPPSESNLVYKELLEGGETFSEWFRSDSELYEEPLIEHKVVRKVADNVIALIISPRISDKEALAAGYLSPLEFAPNYTYDSRIKNPTGNRKVNTTHQLPPLVKIIMISISELSAAGLAEKHGSAPPPELMIEGSLFTDSLKLDRDLKQFEEQLSEHRIEYRIFQTVVGMQGAKWSE